MIRGSDEKAGFNAVAARRANCPGVNCQAGIFARPRRATTGSGKDPTAGAAEEAAEKRGRAKIPPERDPGSLKVEGITPLKPWGGVKAGGVNV